MDLQELERKILLESNIKFNEYIINEIELIIEIINKILDFSFVYEENEKINIKAWVERKNILIQLLNDRLTQLKEENEKNNRIILENLEKEE